MDNETQLQAEAAAFRTLVKHLQERTDVQNIDMMNLTGFCRNCLGRWYQEGLAEQGIEISKEDGRAHIHGMPTAEWKEKFQTDATPQQQADFKVSHARTHNT